MRYSKCLTQFYLFKKKNSYFMWVKGTREYVQCKPHPSEPNSIYTDAELKAIWFLEQEEIVKFAKETPDWKYRYYKLRKHVIGNSMYTIEEKIIAKLSEQQLPAIAWYVWATSYPWFADHEGKYVLKDATKIWSDEDLMKVYHSEYEKFQKYIADHPNWKERYAGVYDSIMHKRLEIDFGV